MEKIERHKHKEESVEVFVFGNRVGLLTFQQVLNVGRVCSFVQYLTKIVRFSLSASYYKCLVT